MKIQIIRHLVSALLFVGALSASPLDNAAVQKKVETKIAEIKTWAADPAVVAAVVAHNTSLPADHATMTQDKWKALSVLDPLVRGFLKNEAATALKSKREDWVSEVFLSDAQGLKVAFLAKTTGWSHAGKPKHDIPMSGRVWQGQVEVDESTGTQQLQVAVPVLASGKPVGSLVVGIAIMKL